MRIETPRRPDAQVGDVRPLKLKTPRGSLSLKGQVVRIARKGIRTYDIGVRFLELNRGTQSVLDSLGRFGFVAPGSESAGCATPPPIQGKPQRKSSRRDPSLPDYYLILGVGPKATDDQIRTAFRSMAWRCHPDVSDDPEGHAKFSLIHEAYKVLRDPAHRETYDHKRAG